ncbi:Chromosomal replication initiator protein DnaA OS=Lysinibacillus sphaericus OX=1421 GN=dnaA_1 PE=4 SV=1 [Lysinibacillus sphaericus]
MIRMKQVDILFIDDLFKPVTKQMKDGERIKVPQGSEWEIKQLYSVVNYRYMNHKPVFISSELTFDEMIVQMDEGLGTRFYQMCKQFFIHIDKDLGLNYRLK